VEVGSFDTEGQAEAVFASGDYAYVADGEKGLRIIDVSDPANPSEIGFYDTGHFANNVFAVGTKIYVTDDICGFYVFEYDNATNVQRTKNINLFRLEQNYPNPFNPTTKIEFSLSKTEFVKLAIFNVLGEHIADLHKGVLGSGNYQKVFDGNGLSNGVYYYKLEAGDYRAVKKMLLIK